MAGRRVTAALPLPALCALIIPVCAGIGWMALVEAPASYRIVNAAALALACLWIVFARAPSGISGWRVIGAAAVAVLAVPLVAGPSVSGVNRWVEIGGLALHSGFLALPALVVASARDRRWGATMLAAALLPLVIQPDAGTGLALTFAAAGIHDRTREWRFGMIAILGFFLTLSMAFRGELPPQPFVERVLQQALSDHFMLALMLTAGLIVAFTAIIRGIGADPAERYGLAGALFGFFVMALVSHYPYPLIGYGASSILGFGLAIGLAESGRPRPAG